MQGRKLLFLLEAAWAPSVGHITPETGVALEESMPPHPGLYLLDNKMSQV